MDDFKTVEEKIEYLDQLIRVYELQIAQLRQQRAELFWRREQFSKPNSLNSIAV